MITPERMIHRDESGLELLTFRGTRSALYDDLIAVRAHGESTDFRETHGFDQYSDHYLARQNGKPVGCLTVNRGWLGPLDCQQFYPADLVEAYREVLISGCKLKVLANQRPSAIFTIIRQAWRDQAGLGARLDLINATGKLVPVYQRLFGYRLAQGYRFTHPRLGTPSEVLWMAVDPQRKHRLTSVFARVPDPISSDDVQRLLEKSQRDQQTTKEVVR